ncbi:MAG: 50S ribosomal protein L13 [Candidatus Aminicenantes bacterium]|nr:50S ribosomal protein L13 [Candidatus Aminicenantes bacterium]
MKNSNKTILPGLDEIDRKWFVVDASDQVLGRLATRLATLLMGKDRPNYTDFLDTGAFVIVVNADKVRLTGKKWSQKVYYSHSRYPGGLKEITAENLLRRYPDRLVRLAVRGMLPKNKLGKRMIRKLKIYAGADHPHQAQKPEPLAL